LADQDRLGAGYVDRILKCEKPADLPGKRRRVRESKSSVGLAVPRARADEVIE